MEKAIMQSVRASGPNIDLVRRERARRVSFERPPARVLQPVGQTTERALVLLGQRPRRASSDARGGSPFSSPRWATAAAPLSPLMAPASPAWSASPGPSSPRLAQGMGRGIVAPIPRPIARSHEADPDAYVTSGAYERDLAAICTDALDRVHQYLAHARPTQRKLVAIFDIDETLLSSHREIVRQANLSYLARGARMPQGYLPPLRSVVDLLHALQRLGFAIVILTGRRSTTEGVTVANLQWVGVNGWDHIIFRQTGTPEENMLAVEYKSKQRERVDGAGYAIVLNIGDQRSDIEGSCPGAIRVKVPHHYYLP